MGFWGSSLYANDITCDVRDSYITALKSGASNDEAYNQIKQKFIEYIDTDEEPLFWFSLAETQWKLGRLTLEAKIKALNWIEKDGGLDLWKDSKDRGQGWIQTLIKLRNKLKSPMPVEKKVHKEVDFPRNPWNINDIYAYQFNGEKAHQLGLFGKYILIQKIADQISYNDWIFSRIHVFDKIFDDIPSITDIDNLRLLPLIEPFIEETGERVKTKIIVVKS